LRHDLALRLFQHRFIAIHGLRFCSGGCIAAACVSQGQHPDEGRPSIALARSPQSKIRSWWIRSEMSSNEIQQERTRNQGHHFVICNLKRCVESRASCNGMFFQYYFWSTARSTFWSVRLRSDLLVTLQNKKLPPSARCAFRRIMHRDRVVLRRPRGGVQSAQHQRYA
jgi:hypothetical protein